MEVSLESVCAKNVHVNVENPTELKWKRGPKISTMPLQLLYMFQRDSLMKLSCGMEVWETLDGNIRPGDFANGGTDKSVKEKL